MAEDAPKSQSTSSVLGHIIKEYGLDKSDQVGLVVGNDLNLVEAVSQQQKEEENEPKVVVEAANVISLADGGEYITIIPPQVQYLRPV